MLWDQRDRLVKQPRMDVRAQPDIEILADTPGRADDSHRPPRGGQELRGPGGVHIAFVVDDQDAVPRDIRARDDIDRIENRQRPVIGARRRPFTAAGWLLRAWTGAGASEPAVGL